MISLDENEAKQIVDMCFQSLPVSPDVSTRLQAMAGVVALVNAMQQLGYKIYKPLKQVENT